MATQCRAFYVKQQGSVIGLQKTAKKVGRTVSTLLYCLAMAAEQAEKKKKQTAEYGSLSDAFMGEVRCKKAIHFCSLNPVHELRGKTPRLFLTADISDATYSRPKILAKGG